MIGPNCFGLIWSLNFQTDASIFDFRFAHLAIQKNLNSIFNTLPQPIGAGRPPGFSHVAMAQVYGKKPPEPLRHFRNGNAFPAEPDSGFRISDLIGQRSMPVARGIPANLAFANDQSNMRARLLEKRGSFQGRLTGSNQCHVAPGKSREVTQLRAVAEEWLRKKRQL